LSSLTTSGGRIFSTLPSFPAVEISAPPPKLVHDAQRTSTVGESICVDDVDTDVEAGASHLADHVDGADELMQK